MLSRVVSVFLLLTLCLNASWVEYKARYIEADGRVIDRMNSDITHSEGVGYAMYFALKNNDIECFKKIHNWYKNNLAINKYNLIGWKWGRDKADRWHMLDTNNATDGDLWIAYDNLLAFEITKDLRYKEEGVKLIKSIKQNLLLKNNNHLYLLPGKVGFEDDESFEVNLSYYLFFVFDKFMQYDNTKIWQKLKQDGIALLYDSRFSTLKLNANWIKIDKKSGKISLSRDNSFGFDALRIPYNILKSDIKNKESLLLPYKRYVDAMRDAKVVFGVSELKSGNISLYNYSYAQLCIYGMIERYYYHKNSFEEEINRLKRQNKNDYYSYSIYLFTTID